MHEMRVIREMQNARCAWHACNACDACNEMYEVWHEMMQNATWNHMKWCMKWRAVCVHAMQIVHFGYTQRDVTLNFWFRLHTMRCNLDFLSLIVDCDHNLIILFLISLRIWSIGVDVKLTQQDVKNLRLHIAPPYHPFCKIAKWNEWERRAEMKWNEWTDKCMVRL